MSAELVEAEVIALVEGDPETVLALIHAQNVEIISQNKQIAETLDGILSVVADAKGEIMPLFEKLESNPMFKMFLGKSR